MIKKTAKLVATAGFVFATFAGAQSASAEYCQTPTLLSTSNANGSCGPIRWTFETSLTGATLSTVNWSTRPTPHTIQIELDCSDETSGSAESFDDTDQSASAGCQDDEIVQGATGWVITNPDGVGQGEGEGEEETGEEEAGE